MSTYTPIASITLASAASSVTFSGIPQNYTDVILVYAIKTVSANPDISCRLNSDTGSNYSSTLLAGTGSAASSTRTSNETYARLNWYGYPSTNNNSNGIHHFLNYSNTSTYKTIMGRANNADNGTNAQVNLWRSTSAITSINIYASTGNLDTGSTFNLYGIANASITNVAKATGGDSVYTDGTYWYHIFRSSGTFTPTQALTADYLVVAGGGGGGNSNGGGGGAGGLRSTVTATGGGGSLESALSLAFNTSYTVTVGAGGAGTPNNGQVAGSSGNNSVFSTITATGGGGGGSGNNVGSHNNGLTGGSGGGGGTNSGTAGTASATVQGYAGGAGKTANTTGFGGGGGGGAGSAGVAAVNNVQAGGNGGNALAVSITGSSVYYAGGGGGGTGTNGGTVGLGGGTSTTANKGGGADGTNTSTTPTAATANTGGGGGGGGYSPAGIGGNGGSGIVVIRYAA